MLVSKSRDNMCYL